MKKAKQLVSKQRIKVPDIVVNLVWFNIAFLGM